MTLGPDGGIVLNLVPNNMQGHHRLRDMLHQMLDATDSHPHLLPRNLYLREDIPIGGTAHQNGAAQFGNDPATSARR